MNNDQPGGGKADTSKKAAKTEGGTVDPRPVVYQCIMKYGDGRIVHADDTLRKHHAVPEAVRACINEALNLHGTHALRAGEVTESDTAGDLAITVVNKMKQA